LGKPAGNDFKEGHVTLPLFHLYGKANRTLKNEIEGFVANKHLTQKELDYVLDRMREEKCIDYTLELARTYVTRAKQALKDPTFKATEFLEHLIAIADHVIDRVSTAKPVA
jgi:geranylgeranyl pyrophosphate synthase